MNNNILCSIALFSELYKDGHNDVFSVVGEFIKSTIQIDKLITFNEVDINEKLCKLFNINIPKSVIKYTLKNRLKDIVVRDKNGQFVVSSTLISDDTFNSRLATLETSYEIIFKALYEYISTIETRTIDSKEKEAIKADFAKFLIDKESRTYQDIFNAFIVQYKSDKAFCGALNNLAEGLVVYSGIQYSEPEELLNNGRWKDEMTFSLDTEQLFNIFGLNDEYYKQQAEEFLALVREVNSASKVIKLNFFSETKAEIESYFGKAEQIIQGKEQLNPSKTAMANILRGCKDVFDVKAKKTEFYQYLKGYAIACDEETSIKSIWNLGGLDTLTTIEQNMKSKKYDYDEGKTVAYLSILSKINSLRNGQNNVSFEKAKYVFISANGLSHYIANMEQIRNENSAPFVIDLEYITSKIWFKLKKSFNNGTAPVSFDVIARSQLTLASQYIDSVNKKYEQLSSKDLSKEVLAGIYNDLRSKGYVKASDITADNLPEIISFINQPSIDDLLKEKSVSQRKIAEAESVKAKYELLQKDVESLSQQANYSKQEAIKLREDNLAKDRKNRELQNYPIKKAIRQKATICFVFMNVLIFIIILLILFIIRHLKETSDTTLGIIGISITLLALVLPFIKKYRHFIFSKISCKYVNSFKKKMIR